MMLFSSQEVAAGTTIYPFGEEDGMGKLRTLLDELNITAEVKFTGGPMPEGWGTDGNAWTVTLTDTNGQTLETPFYTGSAISEPSREDVVSSLVTDTASLDEAMGFEEWAENLGYDTDSRKAEKTYQAVLEQAHRVEVFFGGDLERVTEAASDY